MIKKVSAAIIKKDNKILICQRAKDDECPLLWEFPGGKQEKDESPEDCIKREIIEELSLRIRILDVFANSVYEYAENKVYFTVFNAVIDSGELELNVHNSAKWITPEEIDRYEFMPPDVVFVKKLKEKNL